MAAPTRPPRLAGALIASGLGLTGAAAWYHFRGMATDAMTLGALAVGIGLFVGGIVVARRAPPPR